MAKRKATPHTVRPKAFEQEAVEQFDRMLAEELPGFAFSPFPLNVSIGNRSTYPDILEGMDGNGLFRPVFTEQVIQAQAGNPRLAKTMRGKVRRWEYASIAPQGEPDPLDLPNPRYYLLDGAMVPHPSMEHNGKRLSQAANTALVLFNVMVSKAWESPLNLRDAAVNALLDHHHARGGSPAAFVKHVERITRNYKVEELRKLLSAWVASKGDHNSTASTKPKPAKEWDDLKTLALFHALRYAAGDRQAKLSTNTEADKVARDAGFVSKGSGKRLRSHFIIYRNEAGRTG
ncbi:MAG TPA: hypothetical protein PKD45_15560, partial [Flavobacteriales bacterium]|nr:hypothetical protein [Flavobacteriales bacterium]